MRPETTLKRSLMYRKLPDAHYLPTADGLLVKTLPASIPDTTPQSGLLDLSVLPRCGFRGPNAAHHLASLGLPVPERPNQTVRSESGEWVLRLSMKEFWVLGSLQDKGARIASLQAEPLPEGVYSLYCQHSHAWMLMTGAHLAEIFAKVCGVDLRSPAFPQGSIAQTSVARVNAIIAYQPLANGLPAFSILSDSASSEYLWDALMDAMQEFGGTAVGIDAL